MMLAHTPAGLQEASPGARGHCPACARDVLAKCGSIVVWHWAHVVQDCDPWAEPETAWHRAWKLHGHHTEVVMRRGTELHRADVVTRTGVVVELQAGYLPVETIAARERFYGRMWWLYRATWTDRLHFGRWGFWWKHGAKSMVAHQRPVYWDVVDTGEVWRVSLGANAEGSRVLGRVVERLTPDAFLRRLDPDRAGAA